jgi:hypothetical protein
MARIFGNRVDSVAVEMMKSSSLYTKKRKEDRIGEERIENEGVGKNRK